jgi:hypothetical protein
MVFRGVTTCTLFSIQQISCTFTVQPVQYLFTLYCIEYTGTLQYLHISGEAERSRADLAVLASHEDLIVRTLTANSLLGKLLSTLLDWYYHTNCILTNSIILEENLKSFFITKIKSVDIVMMHHFIMEHKTISSFEPCNTATYATYINKRNV